MSKITSLNGYMVLDSRGYPTVACELFLDNAFKGVAYVPSGASTGQYEALELRDGDLKNYCGKGVKQPINFINEKLNKLLCDQSFDNQSSFDQCLKTIDGTDGYRSLGANTVLSLSLAFSRASAQKNQMPLYQSICDNDVLTLPVPMLNVINGGAHANNNLDIQEFMIVPHGFELFSDAIQAGCEVYHHLKKYLSNHDYTTAVGDEGGFAPNVLSASQVLEILSDMISQAGYQPGKEICFALDIAASEFYKNGLYTYDQKTCDSESIINTWSSLTKAFPIISIEDPLADDDLAGWQLITKKLGDKQLIVGDDLLVTSYNKLKLGIEQNWMNSILIKLNQVGTLTQTLQAINLAKSNNKSFIISHRSGETEDDYIADLAIATNAPFIKTGAPCRSERLSKYNRLLSVEYKTNAKLFKIDSKNVTYG